jgi:hypothetical protein
LRGIGPEPICVLWRGAGNELSTADTGTQEQARWHDDINTVRFRVLRVLKNDVKRAGKEWLGGFHDTGESHHFTTGERVVVYTSLREDMPMRFAIALIAALAASSKSSAQEPVLDLLAPRADNDTRSAGDLLSVPGGVIGVVGQHQPLLSLRLNLTALDRGTYRVGDDFSMR